MGKYSIDAFEVHPLVKWRPVVTKPKERAFRLLELRQSELEPESGALLAPPAVEGETVILLLHLDGKQDLAGACGFIHRMGACYGGGGCFAAVVMNMGSFSGAAREQLVQAYARGFEKTILLAEPGSGVAEICRRMGIAFGLWLELERGILPLRRGIGQEKLGRVWEKCPVYLRAGRSLTEEELDAARRWHISGADGALPCGGAMTLRRMMFPRDLTAGDPMPLRLWWQNIGTAPIYDRLELKLELRGGESRHEIAASCTLDHPGVGDSTMNLVARLPEAACGTYELWCGLKSGNGLLPLAMEAREEEGMYRLGEVTLDDVPRPYLATMWEAQYADGYYPLEDPAQPE